MPLGWTIIGLLLVLAVVARSTIGRRLVLWFFTLLLIFAVGAQIWFGSLLMFDTPSGPLGKFNYAETQPESPPATLEPAPPAGTVPATRPSTTTRPNVTEAPAVPTPADITAAIHAPATLPMPSAAESAPATLPAVPQVLATQATAPPTTRAFSPSSSTAAATTTTAPSP